MSQPRWKLYEGADYFSVFVDETGVYPPEMVLAQDDADDASKFVVYRFPLERFKVVKRSGSNFLVNDAWRPDWPHNTASYEPWFLNDLDDVASSCGRTKADIIKDLVDADPMRRSRAHEDIGGCFGFDNFDHYPRVMTEKKMSAALRGR